jgi:3'-phosphoadenosine 5'-phosphosulfate sulfotransferase (PAPS reductase)/FAD synthetase
MRDDSYLAQIESHTIYIVREAFKRLKPLGMLWSIGKDSTALLNIPFVPAYLARDGKRYRSIGERNITIPIESTGSSLDAMIAELDQTRVPERAGRPIDHETEDAFERLRTGGYM